MQKHTPALEIKQETSFFFILWILRLQYDANTIYGILPTASPNFRLRPYVTMSMRLCNFRRWRRNEDCSHHCIHDCSYVSSQPCGIQSQCLKFITGHFCSSEGVISHATDLSDHSNVQVQCRKWHHIINVAAMQTSIKPVFDTAQFNISLSFGSDTHILDTVQPYILTTYKYISCMSTKYK